MAMSKTGTPFRGAYPMNSLGKADTNFVMNVTDTKVNIEGNQFKYVKPTVLTTRPIMAAIKAPCLRERMQNKDEKKSKDVCCAKKNEKFQKE